MFRHLSFKYVLYLRNKLFIIYLGIKLFVLNVFDGINSTDLRMIHLKSNETVICVLLDGMN